MAGEAAVSRRTALRGVSGLGGVLALGGLAACSGDAAPGSVQSPNSLESAIARVEASRRRPGSALVSARLRPQPVTLDLGGQFVDTWAYGDTVPGPLIRATAGDRLRVVVENRLPSETSVHWHGIALRNDMDGVPGMTQDPIGAGEEFRYEFVAPDPGTYFYHPHTGVQLDRGLYGVLVVEDPDEPGDYDAEWIVVLDDWVDGTGRSPDDVLEALTSGAMGGTGAMDHGPMGGMGMGGGEAMRSPLLGGAGDVDYPHYLVNGRVANAPVTLSGNVGQRVRIRLVNAGSDTAFRVAVGGHRLTVTHSDGFPCVPVPADALLVGMGERYDVTVTLADGVFPLTAVPEGKQGRAMAVVRTSAGPAPGPTARPRELDGTVLLGTDLRALPQVELERRDPDRVEGLRLGGSMGAYRWTINGSAFPDTEPIEIRQGERVRLRFENATMMFHPMHVHGHTFAIRQTGARKDTVIVRPMQALEVDLDADNPGLWATHCHNLYHAETGMMTALSYRG